MSPEPQGESLLPESRNLIFYGGWGGEGSYVHCACGVPPRFLISLRRKRKETEKERTCIRLDLGASRLKL